MSIVKLDRTTEPSTFRISIRRGKFSLLPTTAILWEVTILQEFNKILPLTSTPTIKICPSCLT